MNAISAACTRFFPSHALTRPFLKSHMSSTHFSRSLTSLQSTSFIQRTRGPFGYSTNKHVPGHHRCCSHAAAQAIHVPPSSSPLSASMEDELADATTIVSATEEIIQLPAMKYIEFSCTICNERVAKTFSKQAYERGVVIIRCDGCSNLHLIADNLDFTGYAERNIQEIAAARGEAITTTWEGELLGVTSKKK